MRAILPPRRLVALVIPMAIWAAHFLLMYVLQALGCTDRWQPVTGWRDQRLSWLLIGLTAAALVAIAWIGLRSRRLAHAQEAAGGSRGFAATAVALSAPLAAIAVLFTALPVLFLSPCD